MQRRHLLAASATLSLPFLEPLMSQITPNADAATLNSAANLFKSLKKSPRMPVMFVGHGSPMNAIEDNVYRRSWQALGKEFEGQGAAKWPIPQLILCISAHWITRGWHVTGMAQPKTIHDFGGFPPELFAQQYPAPGAPETAKELAAMLKSPIPGGVVGVDNAEWGLDHGTWSVIKPMFPKANIPVMQLSMDYSRAPSEHYALGQQLKKLRDYGVLIVGSGNIVHNLRAIRQGTPWDWNIEFDSIIAKQLASGNLAQLADFQKLGEVAKMAHPTYDHYLPLLYAAGAAEGTDQLRTFNDTLTMGSISMRSTIWS
jgi:4,5-DOPA dioxygenase extradiol